MAFKAVKSATTYANAAAAKAAQVEGGTVANAGNIDTDVGPIKNDLALADMNPADDSVADNLGSRVVANDGTTGEGTDSVGIAKAVSGGTLAYNASATEWVMHGGNVSATLGGVSNTVLGSAGSDLASAGDRGTENIKIDDRKLGLAASGDINVMAPMGSGIHSYRTKSADAGDRLTFVNSDDGTDAVVSEIKSTRAIPGKLTYMFGRPNPANNNKDGDSYVTYKARDAKET